MSRNKSLATGDRGVCGAQGMSHSILPQRPVSGGLQCEFCPQWLAFNYFGVHAHLKGHLRRKEITLEQMQDFEHKNHVRK